MCSRVIIEQKIADLELALARQEELILSQRSVLSSLKELIHAEYQKNDDSLSSIPVKTIVRPSQNISYSSTGGVIPRSHSHIPSARIQFNDAASLSASRDNNGIAAVDFSSIADLSTNTSNSVDLESSSRKRFRPNESAAAAAVSVVSRAKNDGNGNTNNNNHQNNPNNHSNSGSSRNSPIVILSIPASNKTSLSSIPKIYLARRRRALEKTKLFLSRIPPLFPLSVSAPLPRSSQTGSNKQIVTNSTPTIPIIEVTPSNRSQTSSHLAKTTDNSLVNGSGSFSHLQSSTASSNDDRFTNVAKLEELDSEEKKLEVVKHWIEKLNSDNAQECLDFLSTGGKGILGNWLNAMNSDDYQPTKGSNRFMELVLTILSRISWAPEDISQSRLDKVKLALEDREIQSERAKYDELFVLAVIYNLWSYLKQGF